MGIIVFYEGDNKFKDGEKARMKALCVKWLTLLNEAERFGYYDADRAHSLSQRVFFCEK